jgi:tetratricopeptide (TPR) repeat protein
MTSRALVSGILVSAFALAPGPVTAQSRPPGDMAAANALYAAQRYPEAVVAYQTLVAANPSFGEAHFFLANALDNQYRPSQPGEPANARLLEGAREHYEIAAGLLVGPDQALLLKRTLQFLAAVHARDKLNQPDRAETVIKRLIALDPADTGSYFALAKTYEDAGRIDEAGAALEQARVAAPDRVEVWTASAQFYNRLGDFDRAMDMLRQVGEIEPANPQAFYQQAVFYEEKVRKDFTLERARQLEYLARALDVIDRALALRPDYFEALTYKNLILRQQARFESHPDTQRLLIEQADALQRQAIAVRDGQVRGRSRP